jgi:signal transduction histidine kinase
MEKNDNREIAFFGKITAGISHEMQNVLSIINESTGLMEDFLNMSKDASFPYRNKLRNLLTTIQRQVERGIEIAVQLNRFAHEPDQNTKEVDLAEIAEYFVALAQRFARLQHVALTCSAADGSYKITTRPVLLLLTLYTGFECCLQRMSEGGQIAVMPLVKGGQYFIRMVCDPVSASFIETLSETEKWSIFQNFVNDLGGTADADEQARGISICLPRTIR